jgi:hypothetical protein
MAGLFVLLPDLKKLARRTTFGTTLPIMTIGGRCSAIGVVEYDKMPPNAAVAKRAKRTHVGYTEQGRESLHAK